jgi:hypothetical protein
MTFRCCAAVMLALIGVSGFGAGQQRALKALVLYDMEGVTGVTSYKHTSYAHKPEAAGGRPGAQRFWGAR